MYTAVHSYTGYGSSNTFVVGKSQRRYHRNDRVRSRGAMTVQSWRQRWHVSQDHLTKSLVEQAEVGQDSRAHGRAVDARVPMDIDRSSVPSASGVGLETSQGRAPPPQFGSGQSLRASRSSHSHLGKVGTEPLETAPANTGRGESDYSSSTSLRWSDLKPECCRPRQGFSLGDG